MQVRPNQPNGRSRCGMTLLELLVVVILMALIAGVIISYAVDTRADAARAAATLISQDLEYARSLAVEEKKAITVSFTPDTNQYTLTDSDGATLKHPVTGSDFTVDLPKALDNTSLTLVSAVFGEGVQGVTFASDGTVSQPGTDNTPISSDSAVKVQSGEYSWLIKVAPTTGRISVVEE